MKTYSSIELDGDLHYLADSTAKYILKETVYDKTVDNNSSPYIRQKIYTKYEGDYPEDVNALLVVANDEEEIGRNVRLSTVEDDIVGIAIGDYVIKDVPDECLRVVSDTATIEDNAKEIYISTVSYWIPGIKVDQYVKQNLLGRSKYLKYYNPFLTINDDNITRYEPNETAGDWNANPSGYKVSTSGNYIQYNAVYKQIYKYESVIVNPNTDLSKLLLVVSGDPNTNREISVSKLNTKLIVEVPAVGSYIKNILPKKYFEVIADDAPIDEHKIKYATIAQYILNIEVGQYVEQSEDGNYYNPFYGVNAKRVVSNSYVPEGKTKPTSVVYIDDVPTGISVGDYVCYDASTSEYYAVGQRPRYNKEPIYRKSNIGPYIYDSVNNRYYDPYKNKTRYSVSTVGEWSQDSGGAFVYDPMVINQYNGYYEPYKDKITFAALKRYSKSGDSWVEDPNGDYIMEYDYSTKANIYYNPWYEKHNQTVAKQRWTRSADSYTEDSTGRYVYDSSIGYYDPLDGVERFSASDEMSNFYPDSNGEYIEIDPFKANDYPRFGFYNEYPEYKPDKDCFILGSSDIFAADEEEYNNIIKDIRLYSNNLENGSIDRISGEMLPDDNRSRLKNNYSTYVTLVNGSTRTELAFSGYIKIGRAELNNDVTKKQYKYSIINDNEYWMQIFEYTYDYTTNEVKFSRSYKLAYGDMFVIQPNTEFIRVASGDQGTTNLDGVKINLISDEEATRYTFTGPVYSTYNDAYKAGSYYFFDSNDRTQFCKLIGNGDTCTGYERYQVSEQVLKQISEVTDDANGMKSRITQTGSSILMEVETLTGNMRSEFLQTVNRISMSVQDIEAGMNTKIVQTADEILLSASSEYSALYGRGITGEATVSKPVTVYNQIPSVDTINKSYTPKGTSVTVSSDADLMTAINNGYLYEVTDDYIKTTPYDGSYCEINGEMTKIKNDIGYFTAAKPLAMRAVLSNTTLTFYYDKINHSSEGSVFDVTAGSNLPGWYAHRLSITAVVFDISVINARPTSCYGWFLGMEHLTTITNIKYLNTSKVTDMFSMFAVCSSLTSVDVSGFDISSVNSTVSMFSGCESLSTISAENNTAWNVPLSTGMFNGCRLLRNYSESVIDASRAHCGTNGYFTPSLPSAKVVYNNSNTLTFYYDKLTHTGQGTVYSLNSGSSQPGWSVYVNTISTVVFDKSFSDARPTTCYMWFSEMNSLTNIYGINNLNTSEVTNMECMFYECGLLESLIVSGFDVSRVTNMDSMFGNCESLEYIYATNSTAWNPETSHEMFDGCTSLPHYGEYETPIVDASAAYVGTDGYFTQYIQPAASMKVVFNNKTNTLTFYYDNIDHRGEGTVFSMNTSGHNPAWYSGNMATVVFDPTFANARPTSCYGWFGDMSNLRTIVNISALNTSSVTDMEKMFYECSALTSLDVSEFDTSKVANMNNMFNGCTSLHNIYGTNASPWSADSSYNMFYDCRNLPNYTISLVDVSGAFVSNGYLRYKQNKIYDSDRQIYRSETYELSNTGEYISNDTQVYININNWYIKTNTSRKYYITRRGDVDYIYYNLYTYSIGENRADFSVEANAIKSIVNNGSVSATMIAEIINNESKVTIGADRINLEGSVQVADVGSMNGIIIHNGNIYHTRRVWSAGTSFTKNQPSYPNASHYCYTVVDNDIEYVRATQGESNALHVVATYVSANSNDFGALEVVSDSIDPEYMTERRIKLSDVIDVQGVHASTRSNPCYVKKNTLNAHEIFRKTVLSDIPSIVIGDYVKKRILGDKEIKFNEMPAYSGIQTGDSAYPSPTSGNLPEYSWSQINSDKTKWSLSSNGDLSAINAYLSGEIHATSGTIGGWVMSGDMNGLINTDMYSYLKCGKWELSGKGLWYIIPDEIRPKFDYDSILYFGNGYSISVDSEATFATSEGLWIDTPSGQYTHIQRLIGGNLLNGKGFQMDMAHAGGYGRILSNYFHVYNQILLGDLIIENSSDAPTQPISDDNHKQIKINSWGIGRWIQNISTLMEWEWQTKQWKNV